jgi:transposase-like protein
MNDKKDPIRRRKFDADFKIEALRMVAEGQFSCAVARSLNVREKLLSRWKNEQKPNREAKNGSNRRSFLTQKPASSSRNGTGHF